MRGPSIKYVGGHGMAIMPGPVKLAVLFRAGGLFDALFCMCMCVLFVDKAESSALRMSIVDLPLQHPANGESK
jgi:hypothetical protein